MTDASNAASAEKADITSFVERVRRWTTDPRSLFAGLGILLYVVLRIAYSVFYNRFGLTPDDVGLSNIDLLLESAVGAVLLVVAALAVAALAVGFGVGIVESLLATLLRSPVRASDVAGTGRRSAELWRASGHLAGPRSCWTADRGWNHHRDCRYRSPSRCWLFRWRA